MGNQLVIIQPTKHNLSIVYWGLMMASTHVTNKADFMFDGCPCLEMQARNV